jgi:hypothetical protein
MPAPSMSGTGRWFVRTFALASAHWIDVARIRNSEVPQEAT